MCSRISAPVRRAPAGKHSLIRHTLSPMPFKQIIDRSAEEMLQSHIELRSQSA
jgi:hypothetical protein